MRQCKGCGGEFYQGETVCPYCGTHLITGEAPRQQREPEPEPQPEPKQKQRAQWDFSSFEEGFKQKAKESYRRYESSYARQAANPPRLNMFAGQRRHALVESILAILFGTFGAQWFYRGQTTRGVLCLCFLWTGIPTLLGIFEGVKLLRLALDDGPFLP